MNKTPHTFIPYPGNTYKSCVRCGFSESDPIHVKEDDDNESGTGDPGHSDGTQPSD